MVVGRRRARRASGVNWFPPISGVASNVCACDRCWASIGFDPHTLVSSLEFRNSIASRLNSVKIKVLQLVAPDLKQQSCRRSAQKISNRKSQSMAQTATSKIKAPPAKNSVVAPTYAYKIIATLGHLCVTAFVLASFAAWYYYLSPKAKLATFCLFIYAHYRYVRMQHANWLLQFADRKAQAPVRTSIVARPKPST